MTQLALASSVSAATQPAVDPAIEAQIARGIELLRGLPPIRPTSEEDRRARASRFKELRTDFNISEAEANPLIREVYVDRTANARRLLLEKIRDKQLEA